MTREGPSSEHQESWTYFYAGVKRQAEHPSGGSVCDSAACPAARWPHWDDLPQRGCSVVHARADTEPAIELPQDKQQLYEQALENMLGLN